jgi:hypothetical protein
VIGTAAVNHVLTASPGSWNGSPTSFSYQWQRCLPIANGCADIPGATASTYRLTSADGGNIVRSTVSATNVNGTSPYAIGSGVLVAAIPVVTSNPVVSGVPAVGKTLSTTDGTFNVFPCQTACAAATLTYKWLRCSRDGTGCASIRGATSPTYTLTNSDAGHSINALHTVRAVVTAHNAAGTASAISDATELIQSIPYLVRAPRVAGHEKVGRFLRAVSLGAWSAVGARFKQSWLRCTARGFKCVPIRNATELQYRLKKRDAGHRFRVRVTASNLAGSKVATSAATRQIRR